jgi:branched-chain amino acid transport system ATP-binding protein
MILTLTGVDAFYGLHHVLHGVSLDVRAGEIVALLGRNGAGKTTTLRTIMGLVGERRGVIDYDGASLLGLRTHEITRRGLAYVPEYRGVFSDLTVAENLRIAALRARDWTIADVLELFPTLRPLQDRKGGHLSGGEQQMLAIGRALLSSPRVLLLDEPSQGLAPLIVETVIDTLRRLRGQGMGILLVEQNAETALELADRVCIIDQGSIVFRGAAESVQRQPEILSTYLAVG